MPLASFHSRQAHANVTRFDGTASSPSPDFGSSPSPDTITRREPPCSCVSSSPIPVQPGSGLPIAHNVWYAASFSVPGLSSRCEHRSNHGFLQPPHTTDTLPSSPTLVVYTKSVSFEQRTTLAGARPSKEPSLSSLWAGHANWRQNMRSRPSLLRTSCRSAFEGKIAP